MPSYRTDDVRIVFEKLVENICRIAGGSDSTEREVEGAHVWVREFVARLVRKVQLCSCSDFWAVEEDPRVDSLMK